MVGRDQYGTADEQRRGDFVVRFEHETVDVHLVDQRRQFEEPGHGRQRR